MPRRIFRRAYRLALGGVLALVIALGALTWQQFNATRRARLWVRHTYEVVGTLKDLAIAVRGAEADQRGFLLTGNEEYLKPYADARGRIALLQSEVHHLTGDNSSQQDRLRVFSRLVARRLLELDQAVQQQLESSQSASNPSITQRTGDTRSMGQLDASLAAMAAEEKRLLDERLSGATQSEVRTQWLVAGGGLVAIAILILGARLLHLAERRLLTSEATQRTLAEQLRTSLDSISQGVGVFDARRRLARWNTCFPVLLGDPVLWVGMPYAALTEAAIHSGAVLESEDQVRCSTEDQTQHDAVTYERTRPLDGRSFEVRRTAMPEGGFVITLSDITQRTRAEAVMREAQRMQAIGQLTGGVAHDFNNLLSVIMGSLELVTGRLAAESPYRRHLERAMSATERGASLTQQLLAFARKQPLAPQAVDLNAMLPEMADLLQQTLGEHIDVRVSETGELWAAIADAAQIESAILNLVLNARDAMPGGGRLTLEAANKVLDDRYACAHAEVTPGDYVMIAISDTGTGMTPEVMERAFEPFFTTKEFGGGTGLGLAMVFGFAKQSNGHIQLYSEPGEGTTVRLYLPRATDCIRAESSRANMQTELPRGSATVLVVEDDPAVRDVTTAILRDLDYEVLEAMDGAEALEVFDENVDNVDLLLVDIVLPGGMKGNEVARRITEIRPEIRVLFMSGYSENAITHQARLDEGTQLISKPFPREQLAHKVADVLRNPESQTTPRSFGSGIRLGAWTGGAR